MMQILPHFYRLENSSLVKFLRTKIILLIKGKAKIQVQEFLIPEAMFFDLYQTEREINQSRTESTNNKNIQHALLVTSKQTAQMLSLLADVLEHSRPEEGLIYLL